MLNKLFGDTLSRKISKKRKVEGNVEVLKKEQKVALDICIKTADTQKRNFKDQTQASIMALEAQIQALKENEAAQLYLLREKEKVQYDKILNKYDMVIGNEINKAKKIGYEVEALQRHMNDVVTNIGTLQPQPSDNKVTNNVKKETTYKKPKGA